jgi:hypothetical protein
MISHRTLKRKRHEGEEDREESREEGPCEEEGSCEEEEVTTR